MNTQTNLPQVLYSLCHIMLSMLSYAQNTYHTYSIFQKLTMNSYVDFWIDQTLVFDMNKHCIACAIYNNHDNCRFAGSSYIYNYYSKLHLKYGNQAQEIMGQMSIACVQ